ncbi:cytochrome c [uncultured Paracoccus sp.]|uniref:c-type cytochrome n=1 Tax=uncultured Paracoccus sp. TaxID=189685 RepID=UPI00260D4463|nr:cytochrome c [uncultured Paracoccus sp.]
MRLLVAAALTLVPAMAVGQETAVDQALEARQGFMTMLGTNMGTLAGMAKGEISYDETQAVRAATNIQALTGYDPTMHFIEGTSTDDLQDRTEALPDIWLDLEGFGEKYAGLQQAAQGIPDAVRGGQENVGPVVEKLGGACKECHDDFRKK